MKRAQFFCRKTLAEIGLLPEEYFFGVEDVDYSLQALRHNYRIVVARRATVWDKVLSTAGWSLQATGIGQHTHKGWQILRRKYLSTSGYVLSSLCTLGRQAFVALSILLSVIWHRDSDRIGVLLRYTAGAVKGTVKGLFQSKPSG